MFTLKEIAKMSGVSLRRIRYVVDHKFVGCGTAATGAPGRRSRVLGVVEAKMAIVVAQLVSLGVTHDIIRRTAPTLRQHLLDNDEYVVVAATPFVTISVRAATCLEQFNAALRPL